MVLKTQDILLLAGAGYLAFTAFGGVKKATEGIGEGVGEAATGIGSGVGEAVQQTGSAVGQISQGIASPLEFVDQLFQLKLDAIEQENQFQRAFDQQANEYALQRAQEAGQFKGEGAVVEQRTVLEEQRQDLIKEETDTGLEALEKEEKLIKAEIEASGEVERKGLFQNFLTGVTSTGLSSVQNRFSQFAQNFSQRPKSLRQRGAALLSGIRSIITVEAQPRNPFRNLRSSSTAFIGQLPPETVSSQLPKASTGPTSRSISPSRKLRSVFGGRDDIKTVRTPKSIASLPKRSKTFRASQGFINLARSRGIKL